MIKSTMDALLPKTTLSTFSERYVLKEFLGKGAFAVVKRCVDKRTRKNYAVKILSTQKMSAKGFVRLQEEIRICSKLNHPNIIRLFETAKEDFNYYLIFELISGGELIDDIVQREFYTEEMAVNCMRQILKAVQHCHENNVIHRDIKAENLLLSDRTEKAMIKLVDFGLAIETSEEYKFHGFAGTPGYLSPEVIKKQPYGKSTDIWACGVVMYILLVGYPPFWSDNLHALYNQISSGKIEFRSPEWDLISNEAKYLVRRMTDKAAELRITASQALESDWINMKVAPTLLKTTLTNMKTFNARRKLKGAILTTVFITKLSAKPDTRSNRPKHGASNNSEINEDNASEKLSKVPNGSKVVRKCSIAGSARLSESCRKASNTSSVRRASDRKLSCTGNQLGEDQIRQDSRLSELLKAIREKNSSKH